MKKMLLVLGVAAAAMTSCTNDEMVEVNERNLIQFESFVNKETRAVTDTKDTDLKKFHVYGSRINGNNKVDVWNGNVNTVTKNGSDWNNSQTEVWNDGVYSFVAYANGNNSDYLTNASYDKSTQTLTITDYIVDSSNDLIGAFAQAPAKYQTVGLTFKHLLTKVSFVFTNNYESITGASMKISNLKVVNALSKGTCTLNNSNYASNGSWVASGSATEKQYEEQTVANGSGYKDSHLFIPQSLTGTDATVETDDVRVQFTVSYLDGENVIVSKNYDVTLNGSIKNETDKIGEWLPGYHYIYTADLPVSPSVIKFTVTTIEGWTPEKEVDDNNTNEPIEF